MASSFSKTRKCWLLNDNKKLITTIISSMNPEALSLLGQADMPDKFSANFSLVRNFPFITAPGAYSLEK